MGSETPKAFLPIAGRPMFLHSLATLASIDSIHAIVAVVPAGFESSTAEMVASFGPWRPRVDVVLGGVERQDSVAAGLARVDSETELVLIHDAARPFVAKIAVENCIAAALDSGAALLAMPATDTIKLATADGNVAQTLDRDRIWLAQTPQIFRRTGLQEAHAKLRAHPQLVTDDAVLIESQGGKVKIVPSGPENRKITTSEDLAWAEWYVSRTLSSA